jgi:DNA-binding HxlR family transcriptional regulator
MEALAADRGAGGRRVVRWRRLEQPDRRAIARNAARDGVASVGKVLRAMPVDASCPVCRTADLVCGKWTLLLVRELSEGCSRFCELERQLAGISPRTLSLRLRALEEQGIVERQTYPEVPPRVEYALTDKGLALLPIIDGMRTYGTTWLAAECAAETDAAPAVAA